MVAVSWEAAVSEMVERVARAIWDKCNDGYRDQARAAIAAMREPTEVMMRATPLPASDNRRIYQAVIDAAL